MICGLGIDVIEISRIKHSLERFGMRFVQKILSPDEIAQLQGLGEITAQSLAARFSAKEAAVKALGTGFSGGIGMHDVQVLKNDMGKPELYFYDKALDVFQALGAQRSHISLSHSRETATAVVVLEK